MLRSQSRFSPETALMRRTGREDRHMPGPGELPSLQPARIIGRDAGLAPLRGRVDPGPRASQVLAVTGEAGMGKTVRLADAAGRGRAAAAGVAGGVVGVGGAGGAAAPPGVAGAFGQKLRAPWPADDAGRLLDGQPRPPRGRARAQVLAQAGGNPMALIELAKVIADDPEASRRWAAEPLPPTDRLSAVITSRYAALPEQAQAALLLAAVADGPDLSAAASHGARPDARALEPAEQLGLITVDRTGLRFSHPLVRSAIYHSAPFARRAAAHRQLAAALHDQPDRPASHLAAAAHDPDVHG